jgi:hypothetical protein
MSRNDWTNENTWRVAVQITNTPELKQLAQCCGHGTYLEFLSRAGLEFLVGSVPWYDESLNVNELNRLVDSLHRGEI